jgi:phage regulator Rha-like protein
MKDDKSILPEETVMRKIFILREQRVMLDRDLAEMYDVKGFRLREQVKRNQERFPSNFMFQLNEEEVELMVSQNAIPSKQVLGGSLPYAFTEHGVLMLANTLKSKRAVKMSIKIIEVFVKMREMLLSHKDLLMKIEKMERNLDGQGYEIKVLFEYLKKLMTEKEERINQEERNRIGYKKE